MCCEVLVGPDILDGMMNSNVRQVIVHGDALAESPDSLSVTDGVRLVVCKPTEIIEAYFEDKKVTIKEGEEFVPYLWSDREIVNIAMLQGFQTGDMLKDQISLFGRYLVIRW